MQEMRSWDWGAGNWMCVCVCVFVCVCVCVRERERERECRRVDGVGHLTGRTSWTSFLKTSETAGDRRDGEQAADSRRVAVLSSWARTT